MAHDEHCACGCGHEHHQQTPTFDGKVTENQAAFLHQLGHSKYLPVARFVVEDSREAEFSVIALSPVFIRAGSDSMDTVKEAGAFLRGLEDLGLLTLDYDISLDGYGYEEYQGCDLYAYFCQTVSEASARPGSLGDTPRLELGSMALTEAGEKIASEHCGHHHH